MKIKLLLCLIFFTIASNSIAQLSEIAKVVDKQVCKIYSIGANGERNSQGSGVIVDNGKSIITNLHVIEGSSNVEVILYNGKLSKTNVVKAYSVNNDLILLKNPHQSDASASIRIGSINKGESVFAIGYPNSAYDDGSSTLSTGIISANRQRNGMPRLQTTAPITYGSSGGGLFDYKGKLVGITTGTFAKKIESFSANLNEIVPSSAVIQLLNKNETITLNELNNEIIGTSLLSQAHKAYNDAQFQLASDLYVKYLLNVNITDAFAWFRHANCLNQIWRKRISKEPKAAAAWLKVALASFETSYKLDTSNYYCLCQASLCASYINETSKSREFALKAYQLAPEVSFSNYIMGKYYTHVKKYVEAIVYFSRAIKFLPPEEEQEKLFQLYLEKAISEQWIYRDKEAEKDYLTAIKLNPRNEETYWNLAFMYILRKKYTKACIVFSQLYQLNPKSYNFQYGGNVTQAYNEYCRK